MRTEQAAKRAPQAALVRVSGLSKQYGQRRTFSRTKFVIDAIRNVDLEIQPRCLTALVGESGSGKSTLARCLAMLERPDQGKIWFEGEEVSERQGHGLDSLRPKIQMIFQDSAGALNPRFSAAEIIAEPLEIQRRASGQQLRKRACELMEEVGLSPEWANRRPLEFSGGQRQRLAIARAIALQPSFLILDESLSNVDLITQAQILQLLSDLQTTHDLTYLLICHDLALVRRIADFVLVMHHGEIVERGTRQEVLNSPQHAHTRHLLSSVRDLESAFRDVQRGEGS